MKKYILALLVLIILIFTIVYYAMKWSKTNEELKQYIQIEKFSYEVEILSLNQNLLINNDDYNEVVNPKTKTNDTAKIFIKSLIDSGDNYLIQFSKTIILNNHHAAIKINFIEIRNIRKYVNSIQKKLHSEVSYITKTLLMYTIFLILYGLVIYIKEVYSKSETEKLKNMLEQFVNALNHSAIVSKTDTKGIITFVNDKFCQVSGYTREELIGKEHNIVRHPEMPKEIFANLWNTIQNKEIFKATIKNRKKNGELYHVDTVVIPLLDINNEPYEYLAVRYEITEIIKSRDKAIDAEKAKNEFLSNMSHELRTPLNAIKGFTSILRKDIKDDAHLLYLNHIADSSEHLISLINDILDLSKLQSGKFTLDKHNFNIYEKINTLLNHFNIQLSLAKLKMPISLKIDEKTILTGDWLRISQIITNLLSNAIKFTPKGKLINFYAEYKNKNLTIVVKDQGIGISKEAQKRIFKAFEQADSSTTKIFGGTGLGLNIVLNLVEQMGGEIKLTSKEKEGSRFEIILPIEEIKQADIEISKYDDSDKEKRKKLEGHILIAEDNKTNQMLIGILVEEMGLTYTMVNDGVEAVESFSKERFTLVLMDENMPNLSGTGAMKKIKSIYGNETPIITLTANVMSGDKEKFLNAGMDGYLSKPIDENELYITLKSFLSKEA
ncbi:MAG: ATP-binding protein [Sulfurimonas sp.]|nr:ATP-binding protein [Sulfurimonas sp.]